MALLPDVVRQAVVDRDDEIDVPDELALIPAQSRAKGSGQASAGARLREQVMDVVDQRGTARPRARHGDQAREIVRVPHIEGSRGAGHGPTPGPQVSSVAQEPANAIGDGPDRG
jgi:hypothetical protein